MTTATVEEVATHLGKLKISSPFEEVRTQYKPDPTANRDEPKLPSPVDEIKKRITADLERLTLSLPSQDLRLHISYKPTNADNEAWIRRRLIHEKEPILFVGESGDRSLPAALAMMRGSWDGIWAGSEQNNWFPKNPTLSAILRSAQGRSTSTAWHLGRSKNRRDGYANFIHTDQAWRTKASELRHTLSGVTDALDKATQEGILQRLSLIIDATKLGLSVRSNNLSPALRSDSPPTRNIWFQCPWSTNPAVLVEGFIRSAAAVQQSDDVILLGLTAHSWYQDTYKLDNLKRVAREVGYEIFMDECLIRHAIDAGYRHEGVKHIHDLILDYHQTFVLVKRAPMEHATILDDIKKRRAEWADLEAYLRDLKSRQEELELVVKSMGRA
ncbi:hypothetical protein DFH09DRAFT_1209263 [Mycena vulgaris]|nr:hypothetical protein DFH09DRAFT_1209244 [Mycena vulgaris]KAJ6489380.1 hypothetical protein DFH09DRAFT_1209263 [Mycena vulgaris]